MSFTMFVVVFGVFGPLAAIGFAQAAQRFGGRRAANELRVQRDRERATYNANYRADYCRRQGDAEIEAARVARLARFVPGPETPPARNLGRQFDSVVAELKTLTKGIV